MTNTKYTSFDHKARYFTLGEWDEQTKNVLIAFHGYGQLGSFFSRHFDKVQEDCLVVIPEGFHHFYLEGTSGRVGSSWMTKEDRLVDIENQSSYINAIIADLNLDLMSVNLIVLGFSQGVSTAIRWIVNNEIRPKKLITWAGSFPVDMEEKVLKNALNQIQFINIIGDEDPYFNPKNRKALEDWLSLHDIKSRKLSFSGKHHLDSGVLKQVIEEITQRK